MLSTLRRIAQEVSASPDLTSALALAAQRIREVLHVAACSVYLAAASEREYVLTATAGLHPSAVGQLRVPAQSGVVGLVAQRQEPLQYADIADQALELGGAACRAFLGVPLMHQRKALGVLVVQDSAPRQFAGAEVDLLVTLAAQLASILRRGGMSAAETNQATGVRILQGVGGAPGIAIGNIIIPHALSDLETVPEQQSAAPAAELAALETALNAVAHELQVANQRLAARLPPTEQALFSAYQMLLRSDSLLDDARERIAQGHWAPAAWSAAIQARIRLLAQAEDPYLSTRAEDMRDLGRRVLSYLRHGHAPPAAPHLTQPCILLAQEISVAHLATSSQLAGVISLRGSAMSHAALLARAMGIPAVMGLGERPLAPLLGCEVIVDGHQGRVYVQPDRQLRSEYQQLLAAEAQLAVELQSLRDLPAQTSDAQRIPLYVKAGMLSDIATAKSCGADGVGVYRTEFAFMVRETFPGEEEQCQAYQQILSAFAPQQVVMRTLDVGGDKPLPYFPIQEKNPFLGWRGMRLTLDHPEIFLTQLRAMLRANAQTQNLRILFPMITTVEEVDEAVRRVEQAYRELQAEGYALLRPALGVMIEIPAAAWQAQSLARRVDFLAVGTNDLTQYLLAVDRDNARVAALYDHLHPALLKTIAHIVSEGHLAERPVHLCGEMAADPGAALLLVGLGADSLSVGPMSLPRVKWALRSFALEKIRALAQQALTLETATEVRRLLHEALYAAGLGEIVPLPLVREGVNRKDV